MNTVTITLGIIVLLFALLLRKFIKSDEYKMHKAIANKQNNKPKAGK
ncbi:MAG TPA: hypothetical protein VK173_11435 [Lacibacter sp.]|nr:hypothetical protein [Lacibacter sp.]